MLSDCPSTNCEIRHICDDLQKIGCGGDPSWLAVVLFVRNLVRMFSIFDDNQKKAVQQVVFEELGRHDASAVHLRQVVEEVQDFLIRNRITDDLRKKLRLQREDAANLGSAVSDFLRESFASEHERTGLVARFGNQTLELLDRGGDAMELIRNIRVLVTDMLRYYRDAAELWEGKARELERMVSVDPLLAPLHNRRALDAHMQKVVAEADAVGTPLAVFMIDVDNFKTTINDVYGHQVGDDVLRTLAKIISRYASDNDWFAARYGGDELVLVCPLDIDQAQFYAEAIRLAVQQYEFKPRVAGKLVDPPIRFTVSIGVAEYQPGMSWADLLGASDDAMYQVKGTGKNNVVRYHRGGSSS